MRTAVSKLLIGTALAAVVASPALAQPRYRHDRFAHAPRAYGESPYDGIRADRYYGYYPAGGWEGGAIARATIRAQNEPGLTQELSPFAKQTATGGPVGGVPGFSGGH